MLLLMDDPRYERIAETFDRRLAETIGADHGHATSPAAICPGPRRCAARSSVPCLWSASIASSPWTAAAYVRDRVRRSGAQQGSGRRARLRPPLSGRRVARYAGHGAGARTESSATAGKGSGNWPGVSAVGP
jgi:hypothetical protein